MADNKKSINPAKEEHIKRRIDNIIHEYFFNISRLAPDVLAAMGVDVDEYPNVTDVEKAAFNDDSFAEILQKRCFNLFTEEEEYIDAELAKPEYAGKSREEIEADGLTDNGQIIPDSLYGKAWKAAIAALNRNRAIDFDNRLQPYLQEELQKPEYGGRTLEELREEWLTTNSPNCLYLQARDAADKVAWESSETYKHLSEGIPAAKIKRADLIEYPLDKINSEIWGLFRQDTGGQIALNLKAERTGSKNELNIYYSTDFENLQGITITKQLLPFDKRVYIAVSSLFNAGNRIITLTQIHYAMGNSRRPSTNQLQKIYDSVKKMTGAQVYVDNKEEAAVYKNYPVFQYEGSLRPVEKLKAFVNGQLTEAAIHVFREPPLVTFAKQRNQLTTVSNALLDSPISKTNANLAIDDYLIERIARAKNGKQPCKILNKTLYERANITTAKQKQRAPETIKRYLDHYKAQGFISGYKQEADAIIITFTNKKK